MTTTTLLVAAGFRLVAVAVFTYVGYRLGRRVVSDHARLAASAFALFWLGLAVSAAVGAFNLVAVAMGVATVPIFETLGELSLLAICTGLWGILYYLLYLVTGRRGLWLPLALLYAGIFLFFEYLLSTVTPTGIETLRWQVRLTYAEGSQPFADDTLLLLAVLLLPQLLAALTFLGLYFRVPDRTQRYRVALVALSILGWFGSVSILAATGASQKDFMPLVSQAIGVVAALVVLAAYLPPRWIQRKYSILSISDEPPPEGGGARASA